MAAYRISDNNVKSDELIIYGPVVAPAASVREVLDGTSGPQIRDLPVTTSDLIEMKDRAAADPSRRRSRALRDAADAALLRGDVPDPDEGW